MRTKTANRKPSTGKKPDAASRVRRDRVVALSEQTFAKAFKINPNPTLITQKADGRILEANDAFLEWFEVSPGEIENKTVFDFGIWNNEAERKAFLDVLKSRGSIRHFEKAILLPSGERRVVLLSVDSISIDGQECLLTATHDVTPQKEAEQAMRRSEQQLRLALEAASMGTWKWDLTNNCVVWSEGVHRIFGLEPDEFGGTFDAFLNLVVPEDRDRIQRELAEVLQGRTNEHHAEFRIRWPDGTVHWLEGRGRVRRYQDGKLESMVGTVVDVTSRKQAEQTLRESEDRFRSLAASAFEGIGITEEGRVLDVNDQMAEMLGYTREELVGRPVKDFVAEESRPLVGQMMRDGHEGPYEHRAVRKDGTTFPVEVRAKAFETAGRALRVTSIRDITERKRAEAALLASEESLRATIQNTPNVAVQWFDATGRVVFWNRASELIYGWTALEAAGKTLGDLIFTAVESDTFQNALLEIERTGRPVGPVEFPFRRRDGNAGVILSTIFRIQLPSGEPRFVCMDVDLTERKAAEESLKLAQQKELVVRQEFAHQLLTAQEQERQRLATELHDSLGQNLSVIKNRADLAQKLANIPSDAIDHLGAIERVVSQAITETRNLARNLRPLHIKQVGLTDSLLGLIREVSQSTGIRFERRLENVDDVFTGESATSLYRIVQEALNNLVKHSRAREARISLERDVRCVRLRVTDDGVGFDARKGIPRTGLGLTSLGERARMLGGALQIQSSPGKGTELTVELPLCDSEGESS
jgi:PAS domain S-box-containing protein